MLLNVFGELETFTSELYPYRFVVTPLLIAAAMAALYAAYRAGVHHVLLRHRAASVAIGVPALVVAVVAGNYLLSPLWERSYLEEASPLQSAAEQPARTSDGGVPVIMNDAAKPGITVKGMFKGADDFHFGRGYAQIIRTAEGKAVLRFENFSVRNGPDLYVYLSVDSGGKNVEEALNLGRLKATDGAFNYDIPDHIDLASVRSVVVWCKQFSTLFAVAALS